MEFEGVFIPVNFSQFFCIHLQWSSMGIRQHLPDRWQELVKTNVNCIANLEAIQFTFPWTTIVNVCRKTVIKTFQNILGPTGMSGTKGNKGMNGDVGATGTTGAKGPTGKIKILYVS